MTTKAKGYAMGAVAAATYGMNPLFALPLYSEGMNADSVLMFRYLFAIPMIAFMLKSRGHSFAINKKESVWLASLGILMAVSSLLLFLSYNYMAAGIASTLLFVYPIMVAVIMTVVFREKLKFITIACIVLAVVGIALLYKSEDGATLSLVGTIMVFGSSLSYALYIVGVNQSCLKEMPTLRLTFYVLLFGVFIYIARIIFYSGLTLPTIWYNWGNLIALALFPTAISFICTTRAIQYIGSTPTAILGALEPVTAVFFGITVFGETLTVRESIGLMLIIVAVSLVVAGGNITNVMVRFRKMFPRIHKK